MNPPPRHHFRVYAAGSAANSVQALIRLREICDTFLPDGYEIERVDVLSHPDRALLDGIFVTPTIVRLAPAPTIRLIGNLSDRDAVIASLGLEIPS